MFSKSNAVFVAAAALFVSLGASGAKAGPMSVAGGAVATLPSQVQNVQYYGRYGYCPPRRTYSYYYPRYRQAYYPRYYYPRYYYPAYSYYPNYSYYSTHSYLPNYGYGGWGNGLYISAGGFGFRSW